MNKQFKKFSTATLAAVYVSSSFVPLVAVNAESAQLEIIGFGVERDGKILYVSDNDLYEAIAELGKVETVDVFQVSMGKFYAAADLYDAIATVGSIEAALELLENDEISLALQNEAVKSKIDSNGRFVPIEDTTKENQTKRYLAS